VWQVATDPINKYDLLNLFRNAYRLKVDIQADSSFYCDRRLDGSAFEAATGWQAPSWPEIIDEMARTS
jgi:dTDP-4-dehydrorhamnose reductase